ncbi:guided entry of tail-anchored proteins factor 1 [Ruminococcus sp.]|uniref:hypothetical protein n=1 Tax=Ruminococcus sp. TaxID=41978 RepID=UPI0025ED968B|nr:hypothetical protein [Ruminococcus sp.]
MSDMKDVYTGAFGKVNTPKERFEIMNENYGKICLEFAGICRRYRLMLDEKFKEIVRLREEVINHQNTISAQNRQIKTLQKENAKLKKALQNKKGKK